MICSRRGEDAGWSPAPTIATKDVQNSISTIPIELSASNEEQERKAQLQSRLSAHKGCYNLSFVFSSENEICKNVHLE